MPIAVGVVETQTFPGSLSGGRCDGKSGSRHAGKTGAG